MRFFTFQKIKIGSKFYVGTICENCHHISKKPMAGLKFFRCEECLEELERGEHITEEKMRSSLSENRKELSDHLTALKWQIFVSRSPHQNNRHSQEQIRLLRSKIKMLAKISGFILE
jgi:hypothetical protein